MCRGAPIKQKLLTLEAGRAAAALLVTAYHVEGLCQKYFSGYGLDNIARGGYAAVDYFFVLSGFIIAITHHADSGRAGALKPFLFKRALRILPMYWLVIAVMTAAFLAMPQWGGSVEWTPRALLADFLLMPVGLPQILPPAWTLQRELIFYLLFGVLIAKPHFGRWLFALWQGGIAVNVLFDFFPHATLSDIFFGPHNLGFAGGMLVARLCASGNAPKSVDRLALWAGAVMFILLMGLDWYLGRDTAGISDNFTYRGGTLLYTGAAMLMIYGLVRAEQQGRIRLPLWWSTLGGASYLMYLLHEPLSSLLTKIMLAHWFPLHVPAFAAFCVFLAATLGVSVFLHQRFEKPLLQALARRLAL